ncbi:MAG: DPP IV N-terminal domain-containing protein, partial [Bryobacter sp.]|nr:DPP IV N-terminal domain-containing protein [Bryobacter sp.]
MRTKRLFALCLLATAMWGQKKPVTLEMLRSAMPPMLGGTAPMWRPDGGAYLLRTGGTIALHRPGEAKGDEIVKMADLEAKATAPTPATRFNWQNRRVSERPVQWAPDGKHLLVLAKGDLFWVEVDTKKWTQLTATPEAEADPKIAPDGRSVSFRRGHDLYALDITKKKARRLTSDGAENRLNAELDWVYPEELDLGTAHWWSPDATRIAYLQFDTSAIPVYPQADLLQRPAVAEPQRYPQAGTPNSTVRVGVVGARGGRTKWLNLGDAKDNLFARV